MLLIDTNYKMNNESSERTVRDWNRANIEGMKYELGRTDWDGMMSENTEVSWTRFRDRLNNVLDEYVPVKVLTNNGKPAWINREIINLRNRKARAYKRMKLTQSVADVERYKALMKEVKYKIRREKRKLEVRISRSHGNKGQKQF